MLPGMSSIPNVALRRLRIRAGLSLRELAALAGVTHVTVSRIETGQREGSLETLSALAVALGVTAEDIGGLSREDVA